MAGSNLTRIRIKDIAVIAGVSVGTVDRVLHNRGEVSVRTKEKIMGIIRELDYQPDILASTLATKRNLRIAALLPGTRNGGNFWKYPVEGIEDGLREIRHFGISLEKYYFEYFDKTSFLERSWEVLRDKPHGLIVAPVFTEEASALVRNCNKMNIPVVLVNANVCLENCIAFVGQDSFQSGIVAARLMSFGLESENGILIVNFTSEKGNQAHILKREEGFRSYFRNSARGEGADIRTLNIPGDSGHETDLILKDAIVSNRSDTRGIFVTNSKVFNVAGYIENRGLENIVLIGYDLLEENKVYLKKGIIDFLISQKPREQGFKSIMALYHHLVLKKDIEKVQYLPIDIITRENLEHYTFK